MKIELNENKIPEPTRDDEIGFIIHDQSSKILSIVPEVWRIPLTIISHVKGYNGVDEYVLELIRGRLEMFADTRDELDEYFQDYMKNIEGLDDTNSNEKYVEVPIDAGVLKQLEKLEERKQQQKNQDTNEEDKNDITKS